MIGDGEFVRDLLREKTVGIRGEKGGDVGRAHGRINGRRVWYARYGEEIG